MPVNISDIIRIAAPAAMQALGRDYSLLPPIELENGTWHSGLYTDDASVRFAWTREQELALPNERARIEFVKYLIQSAIDQLDSYFINAGQPIPAQRNLAQPPPEEPVIDVDFS